MPELAVAVLAVGLAITGAYQQAQGHDGSGWGFMAFIATLAVLL